MIKSIAKMTKCIVFGIIQNGGQYGTTIGRRKRDYKESKRN